MKIEDSDVIGVSFDLSKTRTGICTWRNQDPITTTNDTYAEAIDIGHLLVMFRHSLPTLMGQPDVVTWIAFEDVRPINKNHSEIHFGMSGVLAEWAFRHDVPLLRVTASKAKKVLTGSGKADKDAMLAAARKRYPRLNIQNHDEADALAVGLAAIDMINWDEGIQRGDPSQTPF